jgi:two-component system cell cycle sensor histidine kinase/response regulator CckA
VRDNGLGIVSPALERIFEPFFTTKGVGRGTGLGLATAWHLVQNAGGRIEVDSTPGEGTAFHVYLPDRASAPIPSTQAPSAAAGPAAPPADPFPSAITSPLLSRDA